MSRLASGGLLSPTFQAQTVAAPQLDTRGFALAADAVGSIADRYMKEQAMEREQQRYDESLRRYDRQEQESLRRYEEGKELNRLEREEMRRRYNIQEARQAAADKRSEWLFKKQQAELDRAEKERDYKLSGDSMQAVNVGAMASSDAGKKLVQAQQEAGSRLYEATKGMSKEEYDKFAEQSKLDDAANALGKAYLGYEKDSVVDVNTAAKAIQNDARSKGILLSGAEALEMAKLGGAVDYAAANKAREEQLDNAVKVQKAFFGRPSYTADGQEVFTPKTKSGFKVATNSKGEVFTNYQPAGKLDTDPFGWDALRTSEYEKAVDWANKQAKTMLATGVPASKIEEALKFGEISGRSGTKGTDFDADRASEAVIAYQSQLGDRLKSEGIGVTEEDLQGIVAKTLLPTSQTEKEVRRLDEVNSIIDAARRLGGSSTTSSNTASATNNPAVLSTESVNNNPTPSTRLGTVLENGNTSTLTAKDALRLEGAGDTAPPNVVKEIEKKLNDKDLLAVKSLTDKGMGYDHAVTEVALAKATGDSSRIQKVINAGPVSLFDRGESGLNPREAALAGLGISVNRAPRKPASEYYAEGSAILKDVLNKTRNAADEVNDRYNLFKFRQLFTDEELAAMRNKGAQ